MASSGAAERSTRKWGFVSCAPHKRAHDCSLPDYQKTESINESEKCFCEHQRCWSDNRLFTLAGQEAGFPHSKVGKKSVFGAPSTTQQSPAAERPDPTRLRRTAGMKRVPHSSRWAERRSTVVYGNSDGLFLTSSSHLNKMAAKYEPCSESFAAQRSRWGFYGRKWCMYCNVLSAPFLTDHSCSFDDSRWNCESFLCPAEKQKTGEKNEPKKPHSCESDWLSLCWVCFTGRSLMFALNQKFYISFSSEPNPELSLYFKGLHVFIITE